MYPPSDDEAEPVTQTSGGEAAQTFSTAPVPQAAARVEPTFVFKDAGTPRPTAAASTPETAVAAAPDRTSAAMYARDSALEEPAAMTPTPPMMPKTSEPDLMAALPPAVADPAPASPKPASDRANTLTMKGLERTASIKIGDPPPELTAHLDDPKEIKKAKGKWKKEERTRLAAEEQAKDVNARIADVTGPPAAEAAAEGAPPKDTTTVPPSANSIGPPPPEAPPQLAPVPAPAQNTLGDPPPAVAPKPPSAAAAAPVAPAVADKEAKEMAAGTPPPADTPPKSASKEAKKEPEPEPATTPADAEASELAAAAPPGGPFEVVPEGLTKVEQMKWKREQKKAKGK